MRTSQGILGLFLAGLILAGVGVFLIRTSSREPEVQILSARSENASELDLIVADVSGAVVKPGVYKLTSEARIGECLELAGGLTTEADVDWVERNLNRAQLVSDGMKIYIPRKNDKIQTSNIKSNIDNQLISINSGSQGELESLPGVGPVTTGKIIAGRPYSQIEELVARKIIGQKLFDQIKNQITLW